MSRAQIRDDDLSNSAIFVILNGSFRFDSRFYFFDKVHALVIRVPRASHHIKNIIIV